MSRRATAAAVAALGLAIVLAGCGGSSPRPSGGATPKSSGDIATDAYRFAACMRNHGYPNFPDPKVSTTSQGTAVAIRAVGPGPGPHKSLPKACQGILPSPQAPSQQQIAAADAARRAGLLSFASCMRAHGVTSFPDPTAQGQLTLEMVTGAGIDLHAPATLDAVKACEGASHGIITPSVVGEALRQTSASSG